MQNIKQVIIHPLVLLSVVDHYNRVAKDTINTRVVGVMLGDIDEKTGEVDVTNSFAVPFDEDKKDPTIWFLNHNFVTQMHNMFSRVNSGEKVVGWYSTGPKIGPSDIDIHETFRKHCPNPVYSIIDVNPTDSGLPISSYISQEELQDEQSQPHLTFVHITSDIGVGEVEEVGVEHLLKDIKDATVTDLNTSVKNRVDALGSLAKRLDTMLSYLEDVEAGKLPRNHQILGAIQDIFNLLPGTQIHPVDSRVAFTTYSNDAALTKYIASLVNAAISLHKLIDNKLDLFTHEADRIEMKQLERRMAKKKAEIRAIKGITAEEDKQLREARRQQKEDDDEEEEEDDDLYDDDFMDDDE